MTATAEPVLGRLEYPATVKVGILLLNTELHHGIHHVLQFICASHLALLVYLTDDDRVTVILFTVVGKLCQTTFGRCTVDVR